MRKRDEIAQPTSCLNRAKDDEFIFVLLGRDVAAPETIRKWVDLRVRYGKNTIYDAQIIEALSWADRVESDLAAERERERNQTADHHTGG